MLVAYFCMEYALEDSLPIFAGGLGVLAGDLVLETGSQVSDISSFVAVGLYYHEKVPTPENAGFKKLEQKVWVELGRDEVGVEVWEKKYGNSKVFLLSTNISDNNEVDREVTRSLYGPGHETMLKQQMVLGIGGVKLLKLLDIKPAVYHLNEGHTAFTLLGVATQMFGNVSLPLDQRLEIVKSSVVATKHTIFSEAGIHMPEEILEKVMDRFLKENNIDINQLFTLGLDTNHPGNFSTTQLLLRYSRVATGVSETHVMYEKMAHVGSKLVPITNGVYQKRWDRVNCDINDLWKQHCENRKRLVEYVASKTGTLLGGDTLTIVWARRFASYKRPGLLFSDLNRLKNLVQSADKPAQIIISGKVAEGDVAGKAMAEQIKQWAISSDFKGKIAFLTEYNLESAKFLVGGADVWLNTPEIGKEACGTSGMKAGLNGALMFSTDDGWMAEVGWANMGWIIPSEDSANWLYKILETEVVPLFYTRNTQGIPEGWVERMEKTRKVVLEKYTARRMLKDYVEKLYLAAGG